METKEELQSIVQIMKWCGAGFAGVMALLAVTAYLIADDIELSILFINGGIFAYFFGKTLGCVIEDSALYKITRLELPK